MIEDSAEVTIQISAASAGSETCTLKNVDGLAADKTIAASPSANGTLECRFRGVPAGTWQGGTSSKARWKVTIGK